MAAFVPPVPSGSPPSLHAPIGGANGWQEYHQRYHQSINDPERFWNNEVNKYIGNIFLTNVQLTWYYFLTLFLSRVLQSVQECVER